MRMPTSRRLNSRFQGHSCLSRDVWRKNRSDQLSRKTSIIVDALANNDRNKSALLRVLKPFHFSKMERGEPFCPSILQDRALIFRTRPWQACQTRLTILKIVKLRTT